MHIHARFQSKKKQHSVDWGWYEEDLKPRHRLQQESRYTDEGLAPHLPLYGPEPAIHFGRA